MLILRIIIISLLLLPASLLANIPILFGKNSTPTLAPILKQSMPSIVSITGIKRNTILQPPLPDTKNNDDQLSIQIGSGVIFNATKGLIVTNAHLVTEVDDIIVTLSDKRKFTAKTLGSDRASDIALLKIEADNLTEIKFANSEDVQVGDFVIAIGNPYGFSHTVTSGIVSALGRSDLGLDGYYEFIQTDAAINQGNSGGGLLNLSGELIGINTAIIAPQNGGSVGLGFAIPSNMAHSILLQLEHTGKVDRGPLGVQVQNLTPELAAGFGLPAQQGVVIVDVMPKTPAAVANLTIGDIITKVNDKAIKDSTHLRTLISTIPIGSKVKVDYIHNLKALNVNITLVNPLDRYTKGESIFSGMQGLYLEELDPETTGMVGIRVTEINSDRALTYELREGDIIIAANTINTPDLNTLAKAASKNKDIILLQIIREEKYNYFIALRAEKSS